MKKKATRKVAKKPKVVEKIEEEVSILDLARREHDAPIEVFSKPDGSGRQYTREVFKMWCVLPDTFKGAPERITQLLGITDPVTIELIEIATMKQFAEIFGCSIHSLTRWRREIETSNDYLNDVKRAFRPLTKNFMLSLYRKGLEEGDPQRFKVWMQIVEDWREQLGIEHSGDIGEGLTDEEKKAIDHLIAKNTAP
mgnify:CR=1 FL=1